MNIGVIGCGYVGLVSAADFAELGHNVVAVLSFKRGTDDIRQSPAVGVVRHLVHEGAKITAFDPAAMIRAQKGFSEAAVSFAADSYAAMTDSDALVILTEWPEFPALDLKRVRSLLRTPIVLNGRDLYSPCQMKTVGLDYISVSRPSALASSNGARSLPLPSSTDNDLWTQDNESSPGPVTQRLFVLVS